jgi:hypothetical protein
LVNKIKIQVIREYTESDIKGLGVTYLLKKKPRVWALLLLCALAMTGVLFKVFNPSLVAGIVEILPVLVVFGFFWYKSQQVGKKLWEFVKDKPQPVKLEF